MYSFDAFHLIPERRVLLEADRAVPLGGRAFDILALLLERAGEVVGKEELIARAWPKTFVEEANLRVHVSALRKALGDGQGGRRFIENVAGRGYSFVAPVGCALPAPSAPAVAATPAQCPLPTGLSRIFGRAAAVGSIATCLRAHRLVSVVGPGGIGKTTVALAVANAMLEEYPDGVCLVDLTPLTSGELVPGALASALRLPVASGQPLGSILVHLRERKLLLVLDNCEHVVDAIALLAEQLLDGAPALSILATSRESLRASLEWVYRLASLEVPGPELELDPDVLAQYAALALFADRAAGAVDSAALGPEELRIIGDICRRLDGIPLAIELAAARVDLLGIRGLAAALDDCFAVLTRNRRTALPRHQTLRAVHDWSYELLAADEQRVLQRLSLFRATFTLDSARTVAADPAGAGIGGETVQDCVFNLAAKSLLSAETEGDTVLYRLLDTTRAYAAQKLAAGDDQAALQRRHALHCCELAGAAEKDWDELPPPAWQARYRRRISDVRAALDWAFGPDGDAVIGARLMAASTLVWIELSLLDEQRLWILRALPGIQDEAHEMRLQAALGNALFHLNGAHRDALAAFARAYELAGRLGDIVQQARTYSGLCANHLLDGDYAGALAVGIAFEAQLRPADPPVAHLILDRMMSLTLHFCGQQARARVHAERVYRQPATPQHNTRNSGVHYDQRVAAATVLSRISWLEGFPDQALRFAHEAVARALAIDHPISLCYALSVGACPVAFWVGDRASAAGFLALLTERAARHGLMQWQSWARHYAWVGAGNAMAAAAGHRLPPGPQAEMLSTLLPHLVGAAEFERAEQGHAGWCAAELLRLKGESLLRAGAPASVAESVFRQSLELAARQNAVAWTLRSATSLARLLAEAQRPEEAQHLLGGAYHRFSEGLETPDLVAARQLLASLPPAPPPLKLAGSAPAARRY